MNFSIHTHRFLVLLCGLMVCVFLTNCQNQTQATNTEETKNTVQASKEVLTTEPANTAEKKSLETGSVVGVVKFEGDVPSAKKINMSADPECAKQYQGEALSHIVLLGEGKTIANVLVKITSGYENVQYELSQTPVILDQKGCQYFPRVLAVQKNQPVKILNSDGTMHNVHILAEENGEQNESMPRSRKEFQKTFIHPESAFTVKCDVHPWMKGYIEVLDHPFFMTTTIDGRFEIQGLPEGDYTLTFWHEALGEKSQNIHIVAGKATVHDGVWSKPEPTAKLEFIEFVPYK